MPAILSSPELDAIYTPQEREKMAKDLIDQVKQVYEKYKLDNAAEPDKNKLEADAKQVAMQAAQQQIAQIMAQAMAPRAPGAPQPGNQPIPGVTPPTPGGIPLAQYGPPLVGREQADRMVVEKGKELATDILQKGWESQHIRVNERHPTIQSFMDELGVTITDLGVSAPADPLEAQQRYDITVDLAKDRERDLQRWAIKSGKGALTSILVGGALTFLTGGSALIVGGAIVGSSVLRGIPRLWRHLNPKKREEFEHLKIEAVNAQLKRVEQLQRLSSDVLVLAAAFEKEPSEATYSAYLAKLDQLVSAKNANDAAVTQGFSKWEAEEKAVNKTEELYAFVGGVTGAGLGAMAEKMLNGTAEAFGKVAEHKLAELKSSGLKTAFEIKLKGVGHAVQYLSDGFHHVFKQIDMTEMAKWGANSLHQVGGAVAEVGKAFIHPLAGQAEALAQVMKGLTAEAASEFYRRVIVQAASAVASLLGAWQLNVQQEEKAIAARTKEFRPSDRHTAQTGLNQSPFEARLGHELHRFGASGIGTETAAGAAPVSPEAAAAQLAWGADQEFDIRGLKFNAAAPARIKVVGEHLVNGKPAGWVVEFYNGIDDDLPTPVNPGNVSQPRILTEQQLRAWLVKGDQQARKMEKTEQSEAAQAYLRIPQHSVLLEAMKAAEAAKDTGAKIKFRAGMTPNQWNAINANRGQGQPLADGVEYFVSQVHDQQRRPTVDLIYYENGGLKHITNLAVDPFLSYVEKIEPTQATAKKEDEKKKTIDEQVKEKIDERKRTNAGLNGPLGGRFLKGQVFDINNELFVIKKADGENVEIQKVEEDPATPGQPAVQGANRKVRYDPASNPDGQPKLWLAEQYTRYVGDGFAV